jgi:hypothetical protein
MKRSLETNDPFEYMRLEEFDRTRIILRGESKKFLTPRVRTTLNVPLLQLPPCVLRSVDDFDADKTYLTLTFDPNATTRFSVLDEWLQTVSQLGGAHGDQRRIHSPCKIDDDGCSTVRVRLLDPCFLFSVNGTFVHECSTLPPTSGSMMTTLVEMSCVWYTDTTCGLALQALQIQLLSPAKTIQSTGRHTQLMIADDDDEELTGLQIADPYEPFC